jgi:hypothetical protein
MVILFNKTDLNYFYLISLLNYKLNKIIELCQPEENSFRKLLSVPPA